MFVCLFRKWRRGGERLKSCLMRLWRRQILLVHQNFNSLTDTSLINGWSNEIRAEHSSHPLSFSSHTYPSHSHVRPFWRFLSQPPPSISIFGPYPSLLFMTLLYFIPCHSVIKLLFLYRLHSTVCTLPSLSNPPPSPHSPFTILTFGPEPDFVNV